MSEKEKKMMKIIEENLFNVSINSAIMINGEWGSGKTHFARKKLIPYLLYKNEKIKKEIYISLYGVTSIDDISKKIFFETLTNDKFKKLGKTGNFGNEIGKVILNKFSIDDSKIDYNNILDLEEYLLVFDDLERCSININDILGYINNFVEHDGIKTLIICNEREFKKTEINKNIELKYLLGLNDNIKFLENEDNVKSSEKKITIEELNKRVKDIFKEDLVYKQIKEKLIGKTIEFIPDIKNTLPSIIKDLDTDEKIKKFMIKHIDDINEIYLSESYYNLRTLIYSLDIFVKVYKLLEEKPNKHFDIVINDIFEYIIIISMKYKKGESLSSWNNEKYSTVFFGNGKIRNVTGFKFIDDILVKSYYDDELIVNTIEDYIADKVENNLKEDDPLEVLRFKYELEDNKVENLMDELLENFKSNKYSYKYYIRILHELLILEKLGFKVKIEDVFGKMIDEIKTKKIPSYFKYQSIRGNLDEDLKGKLSAYISRLDKHVELSKTKSVEYEINSLIKSCENWSDDFYNYILENKNDFLNGKRFLSIINIENLVNVLKYSKNYDIYKFRYSVDVIYNFGNFYDFFSDDKTNMEELLNLLNVWNDELESNNNKIKKFNIDYLMKMLIRYIEIMDKKIKDD